MCFLRLAPLPATIQDEVVPVVRSWSLINPWARLNGLQLTLACQKLPFWAIVSFGAYLLFRLGLGVYTFNDVPQAHKELMAEIDEAKEDLRKKGVDVD